MRCVVYYLTTVATVVSNHCSDMNLKVSQPTEETPVTTDIHSCARFKSILISAPHVRDLSLFRFICIKQLWLTSQGS